MMHSWLGLQAGGCMWAPPLPLLARHDGINKPKQAYNEKYRDSCQRQGVPMQADHGRHAPLQARDGQGGHRDVWWLVRRVRLPVLLHRVGVQGRRR